MISNLDLSRNAATFAAACRRAEAARQPLAWWKAQAPYAEGPAFAAFYDKFYQIVAAGRTEAESRPQRRLTLRLD